MQGVLERYVVSGFGVVAGEACGVRGWLFGRVGVHSPAIGVISIGVSVVPGARGSGPGVRPSVANVGVLSPWMWGRGLAFMESSMQAGARLLSMLPRHWPEHVAWV